MLVEMEVKATVAIKLSITKLEVEEPALYGPISLMYWVLNAKYKDGKAALKSVDQR